MKGSRLQDIRLVLLDVDGVLTDGAIIYDDRNVETKIFNVKDGLGIRLLLDSGIQVGIITGRSSNALRNRCKDLGIEILYDGIRDKSAALDSVLEKTGVKAVEVAFIGDDLPDLPVFKKVGLPIAVGDAAEIVRDNAKMVTKKKGGDGAVREVSESILKAKGLWEGIVNSFI